MGPPKIDMLLSRAVLNPRPVGKVKDKKKGCLIL